MVFWLTVLLLVVVLFFLCQFRDESAVQPEAQVSSAKDLPDLSHDT